MDMYMDGRVEIKVEIVGEQELNPNDPWANLADRYTILRSTSKEYNLPNEFPGEIRLRRRIQ